MEDVLKLHECHKRKLTLKQAFYNRGMENDDIPLKQLSAKGEFSALVNWSRHKLPKGQNMTLRIDVEGVTYQTTLRNQGKELRVGTIRKEYGPGAIRYDWLPGITYHSLDTKKIEESIKRADLINDAKMKGQEMTQEMILQYEEERELINDFLET